MNQDLYDNARWLIGAIARGFNARRGEGVGLVLERMAEQALDAEHFRPPDPATLPVVKHLPQCIGETMLVEPGLAAAIAAVEEDLHWRQTLTYSDAQLGAGFLANYGWAQIIGPRGFFTGEDFMLGLLMLGPGQHYRDHYHPAPELYWPLTPAGRWSRDGGPFEAKPAGATLWHPPMIPHAMKTEEMPLLAVWSWTRDTAASARLA